VGATYLLAMLVGGEPRGLPGTTIDRIELQRATEGFPLDDVIIHAHDAHGVTAALEIQVKRSITFAPSDPVFKAVVEQIVDASKQPGFWDGRNELAIATAQISRKISGAYQDVLAWARQLDAATFAARIRRPGSTNADMRVFHQTFVAQLRAAGATADDVEVWKLLRRLQILIFDYTAPGSAHEHYARERAAHALHPEDAPRAGALWDNLDALAIQIAAVGGQRDRGSLIQDIADRGFRLAGDRRHATARAALAEATQQALADIDVDVRGTTVGRHQYIGATRAAFESARYVEIRGDAGVGKSGLLKHFALQAGDEGRLVVLTPGRVTPRGWTALRNAIGFEGTATELLLDLAAGGGGLLCVDSLDFFDELERKTVSDLVRAAASVPGIHVLATARREFGATGETWLPADALAALSKASPVVIGGLGEAELDELRQSAPHLSSLLSDDHLARDVTRNLFRLARLADQSPEEPSPRSEVDMAELWWRTADGKPDAGRRERARLLRSLAEQALSRTEPMIVTDKPPEAVDALIKSESLRDLGNDRVTFRHDVLREWAIANLLMSETGLMAQLPLKRPAPVALVRGVELAARFAIERQPDSAAWEAMLAALSADGAHKSWRRAVLLALVHSEVAIDVLSRASSLLLADDAVLLCELIPLVMAVDSRPGKAVFAEAGVDANLIPDGLNVPSEPSWSRLIMWLLRIGDALPATAIPEVTKLFQGWCIGAFGRDPLTPLLLPKLKAWLVEIEMARDPALYPKRWAPFGGGIDDDRLDALEDDLRTTFLLFCFRTPDLAVAYLQELQQLRRRAEIYAKLLKFRGSLAQAAPAELAAITAEFLIPTCASEKGRSRRRRLEDEALSHVDSDFLPASPAQGPFFELLTHAPTHGLALIRKIIDYVDGFNSKGEAYDGDAFFVSLPEGTRAFPWRITYNWARQSRYYSLTSALMALEAWAHSRIEAGEEVGVVIKDVIGAPDAPAAYLLVVVDMLISHWPASRDAAVPYVACPELLAVDRGRQATNNFEMPDIFGIKDLQKEPTGPVNTASLKAWPSRRVSLERLLVLYAQGDRPDLWDALVLLLRKAQARLGTFAESSTFADPEFMVAYALNVLDLANYRDVDIEQADGSKVRARQYVSPEGEDKHLAALRENSRDRFEESNIQMALSLAIEDQSRSTLELAAAAVAWAHKTSDVDAESEENDEAHDGGMRRLSIISAAMIAMRDGAPELRAEHKVWAKQVFAETFAAGRDPVHRVRAGLRFNPLAIAFVGTLFALDGVSTRDDLRAVLEIAAYGDAAPAQGIGAVKMELARLDPRLPRSLLRVAFAASLRAPLEWDATEAKKGAQAKVQKRRCDVAIDAELAWLSGQGAEPGWPSFPSEGTRRLQRRGFRIGGPQEEVPRPPPRKQADEYVDDQDAALWLSQIAQPISADNRTWLLDVVKAYAKWTYEANGAGLPEEQEVARRPQEWNEIYFAVLAHCVPGLDDAAIDRLVLAPLASLPDRDFFDAVTRFLRSCDEVYFNSRSLDDAVAVRLREKLSERLMKSWGWRDLRGSTSTRVEMHLRPAVAVFFFNDNDFGQPSNCYLLEKAARRLDPFLSVIEKLAVDGASPHVATLTLNVLEVAPQPHHLSLLIKALGAWLDVYSADRAFWVDQGVGRRACIWIEAIREQEPAAISPHTTLRGALDHILAALVALGVPEARRLELELAEQ
jgi:hypothetical protein